uniref:Reverse transcriptase domain-containing protein n=1 Tax=Schistocephalus solidus TaxID=70667 RepID=A0A183TKV5_SCHSO
LLFADDCALNTVTEKDMQRSMDLFSEGCADFGLIISTAKTVIMHQPPPSAEYNAPRINVNGAQCKNREASLI